MESDYQFIILSKKGYKNEYEQIKKDRRANNEERKRIKSENTERKNFPNA